MKERNIEDYSVLSYIECPICNKKNIDYIRLQTHLKKNHKINVLQDYNFEISETSIDDDEKTLTNSRISALSNSGLKLIS